MKNAPCKDCGKDTEPTNKAGDPLFKQWDMYLVRDEVWREGGMLGWDSGYLCTPCLSKRLGRDPIMGRDYIVRPVGVTSEGLKCECDPDYFKHPSVNRKS
jgi:hypothetical protein